MMDWNALWAFLKDIIKDIALYLIPIAAFVVSLVALKRSSKSLQVQLQLSDVEEKLKEYELALKKYELEKIEKERSEEKVACVEARVVKISNGNYRLKVWNSGNATAYNVDYEIPKEYNMLVMKSKTPFEYLEPGNNFEDHVIIHLQSSDKFKIITYWENENGEKNNKEQIRSI